MLASVPRAARRVVVAGLVVLALVNATLMIDYRLGWIPVEEPPTPRQLVVDRLTLPARLLSAVR